MKEDEFIVLRFPLKYRNFVGQIRRDSENTFVTEHAGEIMLSGKKIVIDLDACSKLKKSGLSADDREFLLTRHIRQPRVHTWRLGNKIYLQKTRGASKCEVHLPMKMMDQIKENARIRNKTISQMFVEMADYYLLTFGDATGEMKEYIEERQGDVHYHTGAKPEYGIMADKRTMNGYNRPDYPLSMTIDKEE